MVWEDGGREAPSYPMCARHVVYLGGGSPLWAEMAGTTSQSKGVRREAESEGSGLSRGREAKLGLDEQKPDRRPPQRGNPARDGEAQ